MDLNAAALFILKVELLQGSPCCCERVRCVLWSGCSGFCVGLTYRVEISVGLVKNDY